MLASREACTGYRTERLKRSEWEVHMKTLLSRLFPCALIALAMSIGQASVAAAFGNGGGSVRVVSTATFITFTADDPGTCNSTTFLPNSGDPACVEFFGESYDATGNFVGTLLLESTLTAFANGSYRYADFQSWNGAISGHGSGSFIVLEYKGFVQSDGNYTSKLVVIDGTGTGDFAGVTGSGTSKGNLSSGVNTLTLTFPRH